MVHFLSAHFLWGPLLHRPTILSADVHSEEIIDGFLLRFLQVSTIAPYRLTYFGDLGADIRFVSQCVRASSSFHWLVRHIYLFLIRQ